jgi:hypothetical protein
VFRVTVLSIALTLAVGSTASLLCRTWCGPQAAHPSGCHPQDPATAPSVVAASDDCCEDVVFSVTAFLREDVGRGVSVPDADHADLVPHYQFAHSTTDARPGHEPGREWSLEERALLIALRI